MKKYKAVKTKLAIRKNPIAVFTVISVSYYSSSVSSEKIENSGVLIAIIMIIDAEKKSIRVFGSNCLKIEASQLMRYSKEIIESEFEDKMSM